MEKAFRSARPRLGVARFPDPEPGERGDGRGTPSVMAGHKRGRPGFSTRGRGWGWSTSLSTVARPATWCRLYLWRLSHSSASSSEERCWGLPTSGMSRRTASPISLEGAGTSQPVGTGQPVLIVSGYGSSWDGRDRHPVPGNFLEEPFSYLGLTASGAPLPYTEMDTVRAVPLLDSMLLAQVWALYQRTGQRVDVVAESEGALVAKTALLAEPGSPVAMLVMASPLEDPGRVSYPTSGDKGWGVASDEGMRLLSEAFQRISPVDLSPNSPFLASILSEAPELEKAVTCPISGIRQFALLPLADATVVPAAEKLSFPSVVLPAFHGGLIDNPSGEKVLSKVLSHRPVSEDQVLQLADEAISYAASAWQVPSLARSDYPAVERANASESCPQVASLLRLALAAG